MASKAAAAPAKKAAKKAPAKKAVAAKKAAATNGAARPGRKPAFGDSAVITVKAKENPKRAKAAERFALYKDGMTVAKYLAAGGTLADVRWDVKKGFIAVKG